MEIFIRNNWNTNSLRDYLYVVKGGTIRDDQIKERVGRLVVPQYFFMAAVSLKNDTYRGIAFWADHDKPNTTVHSCITTIDRLEELTGIDFFCNLPDDVENTVESTVDYAYWKLN